MKNEIEDIINLNTDNTIKEMKDMAEIQMKGIKMSLKVLFERNKNFLMICDDVGLGKTYEGLGILFSRLKKNSNFLIIAPNELIANKWVNEYQDFQKKCYIAKKPKRIMVTLNEFIDNPLKLLELDTNKPNISIIRVNSFSYIDYKKLSEIAFIKENYKNELKEINNEIDNDIKNELIEELLKDINLKQNILPKFDIVIIDESQNIRGLDSKKVNNFNNFFGLYRKRENDDREYNMKFKKTIFLTATPYHGSKNDLKNQISFVCNKDLEKKVIDDEKEITLEKEIFYVIKRDRKFCGKNKYHFREFRADTADMKFLQKLTMSLIQKKEIAKKDGHIFKMGYLDGFERFLPPPSIEKDENDEENDDSDYDLKDKRDDNEDNYLIKDFLDKLDTLLEKNYSDEIKREQIKNQILSHPKPFKTKELLRDTKDKTLIFVRLKSSIKDIEKELITNFDTMITDLIKPELISLISNSKTKSDNSELIKNIERKLKKNENIDNLELIKYLEEKLENEKKDDDDEDEEEEKENTDEKEIDEEESLWLKYLKRDDNNKKYLYKEKIKFTNYNMFDEIWEENYLDLLHIDAKVKYRNKNNIELRYKSLKNSENKTIKITTKDIEEEIKDKEGSFEKRLLRKRSINLVILKKLKEEEEIEDYFYKEYKAFYFNENSKEKKENSFDFSEDLIKTFKHKKSIWSFWNKLPMLKEKESLLQREFMKNIIKKNIINSDSILYFIIFSLRLKIYNKKDNKVNYQTFLNNIDKLNNKNSKFWERINNKINYFIDNFDKENKVLKYKKFYKDDEKTLDEEKIKDFVNKNAFCINPIAGCSSDTSKSNENKARWFNTSFYPEIIIATDIFKEGIDLQMNCSRVIHYGIAWLPGDMEQRIGRVDRFFSKVYSENENGEKDKKIDISFIYMKNTIDERQVATITSNMIESINLLSKVDFNLEEETNKTCDTNKEVNPIDANINILNNMEKYYK